MRVALTAREQDAREDDWVNYYQYSNQWGYPITQGKLFYLLNLGMMDTPRHGHSIWQVKIDGDKMLERLRIY